VVSLSVASSDTVLVEVDEGVSPAGAETVLGWQRVPADQVPDEVRAIPNAFLYPLDLDPTDEPFGPDQWGLEKIGIRRAWQESTGGGVTIAIIDTGIVLTHPDLADRIFVNRREIPGNGIDDDNNGLVDDVHGWDAVDDDNDPTDDRGHGTEVAGVAAASLNGEGIAGAAPRATILPIRVCREECELFKVAWAVKYAVDMGADVINLSIGGSASDAGPLSDAIEYAGSRGVLVVAAAGNGNSNIDGSDFVPASLSHPNLVAVAATGRDDRLASGSNYGPSSVALAAPGAQIVTTTLESLGTYRTVSGTSFAAPHVAATAALLVDMEPTLRPEAMIQLMGRYGSPTSALEQRTSFATRLRADLALVAGRFTDIEGIFAADIAWLATEGITRGCNPPTNDRYCPHEPVTRGEMAAFLHRALDLPAGPDRFVDDADSVFQSDVNALAAAGITKGCNPPTNDRYCPHEPVTRGEMAAFLHRALR